MNRNTLIILPAALLSGIAMAETVSPEQALDKARCFFQQPARLPGRQATTRSLTLAHTAQANGETYFYVFNNPTGGYVIVGGDDVARDILAYSESGTFDYDQLAPAARWWLGQYQSQIHSAIAAERRGIPAYSADTLAESWPEVKPLLGDNNWGQASPFNEFILDNHQNGNQILRYLTGCVATATAQVMHYWNYPEHGMGCHAYQYLGQQLEADFAASTYQWDLIQDVYGSEYNGTPEEDAVAKLLSDVGIALNMKYGSMFEGGSVTSNSSIPYALRTYFGYNKNMRRLMREYQKDLSDGEWEEIVYRELAEGRPVIYGGSDPNSPIGHTFVCDGYKDGFFHINWGWYGTANQEYYLLTSTETTAALTPIVEGLEDVMLDQYNMDQEIIIGIQPDPESEGFVYLTQPMDIPAEASLHSTLHYEGRFHNPTSHDVRAVIRTILLDQDGFFTHDSDIYTELDTVLFPAKQEFAYSIDIPTDSLIPGVNYFDIFELIELSDPDTTDEGGTAQIWNLCTGNTHIEGPEYMWLELYDRYATLCVPFDTELPEGIKAYTAECITADDQVIMKPAYSIEASKGYLLISDEPDMAPILLSGMRTTDEVWGINPVFKGNMTSENLLYDSACYASTLLDGKPILVRCPKATVGAHRVIIDGSLSDAEILYYSIDETTCIQQVDRQHKNSLPFNLMGQPQHEVHGLIVEGGRVIFVQ